jgi:serine/threonine protein kinase
MRSSDARNLPHGLPPSARAAAIQSILDERSRRQAAGDITRDEQLLHAHPELMPELREALSAAKGIRRAVAEARRAGAPIEPLTPLTDEELTAPLVSDDGAAGERAPAEALPAIAGYTIEQEVGSGGQAVVYKARQDSTGQRVAIKVLPGGPFISSRQRERFDRETAILASIQHPHIVSIIERGRTADGSFFFVMPFVAGLELDEHVSRQRAAAGAAGDTTAILRLLSKVAQAVGEAHRLRIVHRDLKPSNVRIDARGDPHILDFGLARPRTELAADDRRARTVTFEGQLVGSLPWASPEQAAGERGIDVRSDVYSLGVMLYTALTGTFPYEINGPVRGVLDRIAYAEPLPPSQQPGASAARLEPAVDAIVLRCLSKQPQDRYVDARELAQDLDDYLAGRTTVARPSASQVQATLRRGRHRRRIASAVLLAAIFAAITGWHYMQPPTVTVIPLPHLENSVGMRLVRVPAGQFLMGSPRNEEGRIEGEHQRQITINEPFYISTTEVTRKQFRIVMGRNPIGDGAGDQEATDQLPATPVSWGEAVDFCRKLSYREPARTYRLPTEIEWEYACRAGTTGAFSGTGRLADMGWFSDNSNQRLHAVAEKLPNPWGIYDMHGNGAEWCSDVFTEAGASLAPHPATNPDRVEFFIIRGGSATHPASSCRSSHRRRQEKNSSAAFPSLRVVLRMSTDG